jgi:hypothetical protein
MQTSHLKKFTSEARRLLRLGVEARLLNWGFRKAKSGFGEADPEAGFECVDGGFRLRSEMHDYAFAVELPRWYNQLTNQLRLHSWDDVVEEAAYAWFNRLMVLRILEAGSHIPPCFALSVENLETGIPPILENILADAPADLSAFQLEVYVMLSNAGNNQALFELALLHRVQNEPVLNTVFGHLEDWMLPLCPHNLYGRGLDYFLALLHKEGPTTEDYQEVELLGWIYQFYIADRKAIVDAAVKKGVKVRAEDLPAKTQIFTPRWIVDYMVQNTVGRTWLCHHPESRLAGDMKYLVEPPKGQIPTAVPLPEGAQSLTLLDPASGSGHILVRAFDLLLKAYLDDGYTEKQAAREILKYNLWGLDICPRAGQLARFALLMKAAEYDRTVWQNPPQVNIFVFPDGEGPRGNDWARWFGDEHNDDALLANVLKEDLKQARNLGATIKAPNREGLKESIIERRAFWQERKEPSNQEEQDWIERMEEAAAMWQVLIQKYATVAANPPYMGQKSMNADLKAYINSRYPLTKADLSTVFMEVCYSHLQKGGCYSMINQHSWMFLSTYEEYRKKVLAQQSLENMLHLGPRTFEELSGEVVQSTVFVIQNSLPLTAKSQYFRLVDYRSKEEKEAAFLAKTNFFESIPQSNFSKIPSSPIAYWTPKTYFAFLDLPKVEKIANVKAGLSTGDNDRFIRNWSEPSFKSLGIGVKGAENYWLPLHKGGNVRKWYGNHTLVVFWKNDGNEIKTFKDETGKLRSRPQGLEYNFKNGITWNALSTEFNARISDSNFIYGSKGPSITLKDNKSEKEVLPILLAAINSLPTAEMLKIQSQGFSFEVGHISKIPFHINGNQGDSQKSIIREISNQNILLSRIDWDSHESSWDFQYNPIVSQGESALESSFQVWHQQVSQSFFQLHQNEEELNRIFIGIYGLESELTPDVAYKDITILQDELDYKALEKIQSGSVPPMGVRGLVPIRKEVPMQQLLHYAMGCLMGRYRLDKPGLHIAHPGPYTTEELAPIQTGLMDEDGLIPFIADEINPFTDNVFQGIRQFLKTAWPEETLAENLNFLGQHFPKGWEAWLLKDFYKFHLSFYQKRPIYWMFSSRNGSFQVLAYMHRIANNKFTVQRLRERYLVPMLRHIANQLEALENPTLSREQSIARERFQKVLEELRDYDEVLKTLARDEITFDLDDGVKANYPKFGQSLFKVF